MRKTGRSWLTGRFTRDFFGLRRGRVLQQSCVQYAWTYVHVLIRVKGKLTSLFLLRRGFGLVGMAVEAPRKWNYAIPEMKGHRFWKKNVSQ